MKSGQLIAASNRPLLPNWASIAITVLAAIGVVALTWHLSDQNRILRDAQLQRSSSASRTRTPLVGDRLPAIGLIKVDGSSATVSNLVADGAVVAFLTTRCPFCEASLPLWGQLATTLGDAGIPFVAISLDDLEQTRAFAADHDIMWPLWTASETSSIRELRVSSVPVTAIVSKNSEIVQIWRGQVHSADVESILRAAHETHGS